MYINEFMASNQSTISDPNFHNYADWLEIYNAGDTDINLTGFFLSDDDSNLFKWKVDANITVKSKSFWGFWADDADTINHTNFKLNKESGFIAIASPDSMLIDSVRYVDQIVDVSFGRLPDGFNNFFYFREPTPGTENTGETFIGVIDPPVIKTPPGFYNSPVEVEIELVNDSSEIYYTLDGRVPSQNDSLYTVPIRIDSTTVLRVIEFRNGYISSRTADASYLINEQTELPVFSIITDPANFFDDYIGIYVEGKNGITGLCSNTPKNWNQDWERPIHIEYFDMQKQMQVSMNLGVKINGGCSRIYPQKSLAFYARDSYGSDRIPYNFFPNRNLESYKTLILRTSAQDWWRTMFRDAMIQTLFIGKMNIDYQSYQPCIVFLNGEYWGIHNIREKLNEHYIHSLHGVDPDNVDVLELNKGLKAVEGDAIVYNEMMDFVEVNDLSLSANYEVMTNYVDIDEYIDYLIAEIYMANSDWPGNNIKAWRRRNPHGKFRWMTFDLDFGFGGNAEGQYYKNSIAHATEPSGPDWPNPPWSTLLIRKLLENENFANVFIQRFAAHMATTFDAERVVRIIDSLQTNIASEIPRHRLRWLKSTSYDPVWDNLVEIMREFARKRKPYVENHIINKFNLNGKATLKIEVVPYNMGTVSANGVALTDSIKTVDFFNGVPMRISANGKNGYVFKHWRGLASSNISSDVVIPRGYNTLTAVFEPFDTDDINVVINEINYNSSPDFDTEDWIELINVSGFDVDLSGWTFRDSDTSHAFIIPNGTTLQNDSLLVLCRDLDAFHTFNSNVTNTIGDFDFELSNGGDQLLLFSSDSTLIDSLEYRDTEPWPIEADGTGATLSLIQTDMDNTNPENWYASIPYGTPGHTNVLTSIEDDNVESQIPTEYKLYQNYPNPFNPSTKIKYAIPAIESPLQWRGLRLARPKRSEGGGGLVTLKVYDILGRQVKTLVNDYQKPGYYEVTWDGTNDTGTQVSSGIYYYRIQAGSFVETKKLVLVK